MSVPGKKIGLMGGTFDPIHYGHLVIAEAARYEFNLEKVIFIPSGQPPHKKGSIISPAADRFEMVELAIKGNKFFEASPIEINRPGPSYTIDTLLSFKEINKNVEIYFITGADAILEILTWKKVDEVIANCYFIAATRPGFTLDELKEGLYKLPQNYIKKIFTLEIPGIAISSTELRQRVKEGKPIKYLLPTEVEKYILGKGLYK